MIWRSESYLKNLDAQMDPDEAEELPDSIFQTLLAGTVILPAETLLTVGTVTALLLNLFTDVMYL